MAANPATLKTTVAESASGKGFNFLAICFLFSGATGLIYEVVWARMLGLVFGATTIAISAVLTAFMGGLALGSAVAARRIARLTKPLRAYALIEIGIGLYALIVPALFGAADHAFGKIWQSFHPGFYGFAILRFALATIVLIMPTALMGATLPVIVLAVRQLGNFKSSAVTRLYSLNLTGAIGGTIAAGFLLLPSFGVRATTRVAALANLLIGIAVLIFDARRKRQVIQVEQEDAPDLFEGSSGIRAGASRFWLACAFASGFVTIAMQLFWSRVLSMIIGSSTYAFTIVLALFLIGLSLGSWMVSARAGQNVIKLRRSILFVQLATALSILVSLRITNSVPARLIQIAFRLGINSWPGLLALQIVAAATLILLPAILMGMTMPIVLGWAGGSPKKNAAKVGVNSVGLSYAINTIGAILGALAGAFILIPIAGTRLTAFWIASICIAMAGVAYQPGPAMRDRALARSLSIGITVLLVIVAFALWPRLNVSALSIGAYDSFVRVLARSRGDVPENNENDRPEDHQLLMFQEGRTATVSVRRDWGITSVAINGRTNASDAGDMPTQVMLGQLGVIVAPRLDDGLIVGFATGVTAGSVLQSSIGKVDCVEIEPAAIASSRYFDHVNNQPLSDPRLHLIVDDARTYLRVNPNLYDVIISEPSHPWVPGVANLFTREFFTLGRERLRSDGVFVQWLQIYQLSNESLRSVLATFSEVFTHTAVFRIQGAAKGKDLILLGSREPIDLNQISKRMSELRVSADLKRIGIGTPADLMSWFVCDDTQLRPALAGAVINTDDNMHVESVAPREAFRPLMDENAAWIESLRRK
ncbi:MAG TPA: fused MFS/spermidine synthase [Pyrinomonadaceae bacterium]|nr:fused MFS/spermidine synthase [Pyrinomonadaceae bacterium]